MKIRSTLPCFTRSLNDSWRLSVPSCGAAMAASLGLSWARAERTPQQIAIAAANKYRRDRIIDEAPKGEADGRRPETTTITAAGQRSISRNLAMPAKGAPQAGGLPAGVPHP